VAPVVSLRVLRTVLDGPPGEATAGLDASAVRGLFEAAYRPVREGVEKTVRDRERSLAESRAEEARDLLVQAAYVDIARTAADGLFGAGGSAGFTPETIANLRRFKVPFAGALRKISIDGLALAPTDPRYVQVAQSRRDVLDRRIEAIKARLGEVLTQYMAAETTGTAATQPPPAGEVRAVYLGPSKRPPSSPR
jgi:hypothetical protein